MNRLTCLSAKSIFFVRLTDDSSSLCCRYIKKDKGFNLKQQPYQSVPLIFACFKSCVWFCTFFGDGIHGLHSRWNVVGDVTVDQPGTRILRTHFHRLNKKQQDSSLLTLSSSKFQFILAISVIYLIIFLAPFTIVIF